MLMAFSNNALSSKLAFIPECQLCIETGRYNQYASIAHNLLLSINASRDFNGFDNVLYHADRTKIRNKEPEYPSQEWKQDLNRSSPIE